ncbi:hypothetical protein CHELA1G11_30157 [Hyphomicrobiales bacterium]|nr:hypothetical protein CHELA1G2_30066 [Hyphomicrobiales bacterium]CAH1696299.1 hypothetical protein CHELA1G11_30157 [Hyphomicrobiales bacterium]
MDRYPAELSYSLCWLNGFDGVGVNHGGRLSDMGERGPPLTVEDDLSSDAPWPASRRLRHANRHTHASGIAARVR